MDLGALFGGGGSVDFFSLLNRAFEQMAYELAQKEGVPGLGQQPPEELLATAVGKRLANMIVADRSPLGLLAPGHAGSDAPHQPAATDHYDDHYEHDSYDEDMAGTTARAGYGEAGGVVAANDGTGGPAPITHVDEQLVERDQALAAALGACDCWGEDIRCHICQGEGGPGWLLPDRQLFATYVFPALRTVRAQTAPEARPPSASNRRNNNAEPKENGYVRHPR